MKIIADIDPVAVADAVPEGIAVCSRCGSGLFRLGVLCRRCGENRCRCCFHHIRLNFCLTLHALDLLAEVHDGCFHCVIGLAVLLGKRTVSLTLAVEEVAGGVPRLRSLFTKFLNSHYTFLLSVFQKIQPTHQLIYGCTFVFCRYFLHQALYGRRT